MDEKNVKVMGKRIEHARETIEGHYERYHRIDQYARGRQASPFRPVKSNPEFVDLAKRSITNLLPLIIDAPVNTMAVNGYKRSTSKGKGLTPEWQAWMRNRMDERQSHIHRAALEAGQAFVTVLPGESGEPVVAGHHAITFYAAYRNPALDEFPMYALILDESPKEWNYTIPLTGTYVDHVAVYDVEFTHRTSKPKLSNPRPHGLGMCPVVRFAPQLDLRGKAHGLVEPIMPLQDKLNQIQLNQLIAQHYSAFMIRYATGLAPVPLLDENGNEQYTEDGQLKVIPPVIDPATMLISADPNTKFGSLEGGSTKDMQDSAEQCIRHMCMVTQTPPHYLLGQMANLSADALAAAESAFIRKVSEIQSNFGEAWANVLRLCALVMKDRKGFEDKDSIVTWADKSNRSLGQATDAFLKMVQGGIPVEIAMRKLPGFSETDLEEALALMEEAKQDERYDVDKAMSAAKAVDDAERKQPAGV
ncbi:phage portal protein [Streptomyces sp. NPDC050095]|uniref:phage portal protein n=1 Tax=unclassified Streptomyces TaxID=2593676 RepID=UPI00342C146A